MLSPNHYNNSDRTGRTVTPLSPQMKRKNIDYTVHTPIPTNSGDYPRKEFNNGPLSPQHYYHQKGGDKSTTFSR
jgi:hypothetical protein